MRKLTRNRPMEFPREERFELTGGHDHDRAARHSTIPHPQSGTISFDRAAGIDCIVRNISDEGACLEVTSPLGIPDEFSLVIKPDSLFRKCRIVWRSARRIGVRFT
jgi:hypothetical protein